jgi:hypothetical protein
MSEPKKGTNDQEQLIQLICNQDFDTAWEYVKYIGYKIIPNMNDRYIFYQPIAELFDETKNNNFIKFYMSNLSYIKSTQNITYLITHNKNMIKELLRQSISPDEHQTKMVQELGKWENGGVID